MTSSAATPWIRSARFDSAFFLAPGLLSLLLVAPALLGWWPADLDTPPWVWLLVVVGIDVAHVWSSLYRVYLDPEERRRRPWLYFGVPVLVYAVGTLLYATNPAWFWTGLAYIAVHHFIRQQIGFVALYRARIGERDPIARHLDHAAIYAGTLVPILYWHVHLPRAFAWFMPGDFIGPLPAEILPIAFAAYGGIAVAWVVYRIWRRPPCPGRDLTLLATWSTWLVGIVILNGDLTFTLTNVIIHGVPYLALVWHSTEAPARAAGRRWAVPALFYGVVLALAITEEFLWDAAVWHDHAIFFGDWRSFGERLATPDTLALIAAPLLTVPQATHYVLDAFIWRFDGSNPGLREQVIRPG